MQLHKQKQGCVEKPCPRLTKPWKIRQKDDISVISLHLFPRKSLRFLPHTSSVGHHCVSLSPASQWSWKPAITQWHGGLILVQRYITSTYPCACCAFKNKQTKYKYSKFKYHCFWHAGPSFLDRDYNYYFYAPLRYCTVHEQLNRRPYITRASESIHYGSSYTTPQFSHVWLKCIYNMLKLAKILLLPCDDCRKCYDTESQSMEELL